MGCQVFSLAPGFGFQQDVDVNFPCFCATTRPSSSDKMDLLHDSLDVLTASLTPTVLSFVLRLGLGKIA